MATRKFRRERLAFLARRAAGERDAQSARAPATRSRVCPTKLERVRLRMQALQDAAYNTRPRKDSNVTAAESLHDAPADTG